MINLDDITIKYINFQPKEVNKTCLGMKIEKLFTLIENEATAQRLFSEIPAQEYFLEKNKELRDKIEKLSGQLFRKKHISYKGNHEWNNVTASKYLAIESKKNHGSSKL